MSIMDRVKKNLREWYSLAADRTGEMAKISVRMYDKYGISREIERQLSELGSHVYHAVEEGRTDFAGDAQLQAFIERIQGLEQDLEAKVEEIEEIRRVRQQRQAEREAAMQAEAEAAEAEAAAAAATAAEAPTDQQDAAGPPRPGEVAPAARDLGPAEELERPHEFGPGPEPAAVPPQPAPAAPGDREGGAPDAAGCDRPDGPDAPTGPEQPASGEDEAATAGQEDPDHRPRPRED
jgi:hypothetical protein